MPSAYSLEAIVDLLDKRHVRATYGAVAALVGEPATFLMNDLPRTPRYSWIVNQDTKDPTGYDESQKHPSLYEQSLVLNTVNALEDWLRRKAAQAARLGR